MPQLIRTPEQIFREEGKDIYLIRIRDEEGTESPAWREIQDWLKANLPNTRVEMLAPSEDSGFIGGYFGDLRVDFSEADLAAFCARWETPEGKSVDPRFQCYLWPYQHWFEKHGNFIPTNERPAAIGITLWWDTPIGFIHHQIAPEEAVQRELQFHPGRPEDLWMHAVRLWPELNAIDPDTLECGSITPGTPDNPAPMVVFRNREEYPESRQKQFRDWFGLPLEAQFVSYW